MNPKAIGVWRVAFERHPDLPKRPPTVTEPQWTFMLFGPGICVVSTHNSVIHDCLPNVYFRDVGSMVHWQILLSWNDTVKFAWLVFMTLYSIFVNQILQKLEYAYRNTLRNTKNDTVQPNHVVFSLVPRSYRYRKLLFTMSLVDCLHYLDRWHPVHHFIR